MLTLIEIRRGEDLFGLSNAEFIVSIVLFLGCFCELAFIFKLRKYYFSLKISLKISSLLKFMSEL